MYCLHLHVSSNFCGSYHAFSCLPRYITPSHTSCGRAVASVGSSVRLSVRNNLLCNPPTNTTKPSLPSFHLLTCCLHPFQLSLSLSCRSRLQYRARALSRQTHAESSKLMALCCHNGTKHITSYALYNATFLHPVLETVYANLNALRDRTRHRELERAQPFGRCPFGISAWTMTIMTEASCASPHSLNANSVNPR
jgi:hypothetical protein